MAEDRRQFLRRVGGATLGSIAAGAAGVAGLGAGPGIARAECRAGAPLSPFDMTWSRFKGSGLRYFASNSLGRVTDQTLEHWNRQREAYAENPTDQDPYPAFWEVRDPMADYFGVEKRHVVYTQNTTTAISVVANYFRWDPSAGIPAVVVPFPAFSYCGPILFENLARAGIVEVFQADVFGALDASARNADQAAVASAGPEAWRDRYIRPT